MEHTHRISAYECIYIHESHITRKTVPDMRNQNLHMLFPQSLIESQKLKVNTLLLKTGQTLDTGF